MKVIKYFKFFESDQISEVPSHFIPLSIGYYLDPNDGMSYEMLKKGGYENDPCYADEMFDVNGEPWMTLTDDEKEIINSVWRSCEEVVKPLIDWNLIDDIKDVALANEIFDKGYILKIEVKEINLNESVYVEWVAHDREDRHYYKFFKELFGKLEKKDGDFSYNISVYRKGRIGGYLPMSKEDEKSVSEMIEQIKDMNPDKEPRIFHSKW
jgi:hypothetical protein